VAILGVGEAGERFAEDLAALGADVRAWDPDPKRQAPAARMAGGAAEAVAGSDVVLSLNTASAAVAAARAAAPALGPGRLYADLNTASAAVKSAVADVVEGAGALFADVALLAPVPGRGVRTPALASGGGAAEFARVFGPLGMPVEVLDGPPGAAAARKLVRSVFMKGIAAAAIESVRAAEAAGCDGWLREEIAGALDGPGAPMIERLLEGSRRHAARRGVEMEAACELLADLGIEPRVAASARAWLAELEAEARDGGR
jgi:3-hydroxyisobutyrate dehydrogenase-like beta-hydroxyacid dehydrogenase